VGFFLFQDHLSGDPQIMKITLVVIKEKATAIAEDRKTF